ncbi:hypothetical protein PS6_011864, partial [Mucor atramentarius]
MAAINIYNSKTAPFSFVNKVRGASDTAGQQSKRFKATNKEAVTYFCPNHGGTAAKHNEKDCYDNINKTGVPSGSTSSTKPSIKASQFLGNKNVPRKSTGNTFCKWCGKLWFFGHVCPEYNEKKHGSNVGVLTIQTENDKNMKKGKRKSKAVDNEKLFRENMEDVSY